MGACLGGNNKTSIIKVSESFKEKKMFTNKSSNKTRATLTSIPSEFQKPKFNDYQLSLSIKSLESNSISNEINITDIQSSYSSMDNNSFIQEITQIIHI